MPFCKQGVALVMIKDGVSRVVVRRETFEDLLAYDVTDPVYSR